MPFNPETSIGGDQDNTASTEWDSLAEYGNENESADTQDADLSSRQRRFLQEKGHLIEQSGLSQEQFWQIYDHEQGVDMDATRMMGLSYIYPERKDEWKKAVEHAYAKGDLSWEGDDAEIAVEAMRRLEEGESFDSVDEYLKSIKSDASLSAKGIILNFSRRGPDFYTATEPSLGPKEKVAIAQRRLENAQIELEHAKAEAAAAEQSGEQ